MAYKIQNNITVSDNRVLTVSELNLFASNSEIAINEILNSVGTVSGYALGGASVFNGAALTNIEKFPFATDSNSADVGDMAYTFLQGGGGSSTTNGYSLGGYNPGYGSLPFAFKFSFASNVSTWLNNMSFQRNMPGSQSSDTGVYVTGGQPNNTTFVEKLLFSTDVIRSNIFQTAAGYGAAGCSSYSNGYNCGTSGPPSPAKIEKFPFATDVNAVVIGNLTLNNKQSGAGQSSTVSGYTSGGNYTNVIDKFPFATDANATDVGDLTTGDQNQSGQSSTSFGYNCGGMSTPGTHISTIQKFPFATDANSTSIGNMTSTISGSSGCQD